MLKTSLILIGLVTASGCGGGSPDELAFDRFLMGTTWSLKIGAVDQRHDAARQAAEEAFSEVARIERLMSEWLADSQLSAINAAAGSAPVEVDPELRAIIERGKVFGEQTAGAFDITWRALGDLWVFDDRFRVPGRNEVAEALQRVDYRAIRIEGDRVMLPEVGMAIGLGGIAKGYAVDRAAQVLVVGGFEDFLLEGGGDLYASGSRDGSGWRVGVRHPDRPDALLARVRVRDRAVVTSGDYERYRMVGQTRYHHILDPRTGWPASGCRSVTIIAPSTETADVLATAVFVLGPAEGLELVEGLEDVDALIMDAAGKIHSSSGVRRHSGEPGAATQEPVVVMEMR